jgi:uncharacterized repeat protein (TIGR03803 family)
VKLSRILSAAVLTSTLLLSVFAQAGDEEINVYTFNQDNGGTNTSGYFPLGRLLMDEAGNMYGATLNGADGNAGTIFELTPNGSGGWNYVVISDCIVACFNPAGSLVMDGSGNIYGTTIQGNVFELSPNGSGGWNLSLVYNFNGGTNGYDGYAPNPGLILDSAGNIYGANYDGGINNQGYVFELSPGSGGYTLTHLHDFTGSDGAVPVAGVMMDKSGNLYGTTSMGGASTLCTSGCGVAFEMSNNAGSWTETVLHSFSGSDGSDLEGPLMMDADGNLYGTAGAGGANGFGVVFKMSLVSAGKWHERVLYSFASGSGDGAFPNALLIMDSAGNLYSTTYSGGGGDCSFGTDTGCGTAFELTSNEAKWRDSILHDFTGGADGGFPQGLIFGPGGTLYGTAAAGGNIGGLVFGLTAPAPARK